MDSESLRTAGAEANPERETEMAELRQTLQGLRKQLAETVDRLEQLEKER